MLIIDRVYVNIIRTCIQVISSYYLIYYDLHMIIAYIGHNYLKGGVVAERREPEQVGSERA